MTASITQAKGAAPKRAAAKPKRSKAFKRENRTGWAFMAPFAILFAFVFLLPIIWAVYSSFFRQVSQGGGLYGGGELVNEFVGFQNFQYVITSGKFWTGVGHVLLYTVIQVPIMIIAALALAMVIDSFVVKHVTGFRLGYFLPYAIPGVVASIIWVYLYNGQISPIVKGLESIGIHVDFFANNVVLGSMANITTWTFTGYNMLIFLAALQAIPHDLYEAARIDGAGFFQQFWYITLPNIKGSLALCALLRTIDTFRLFEKVNVLTGGGPAGTTTTITQFLYTYGIKSLDFGFGSAGAIVMTLLVLILSSFYIKRAMG